MAAVRGPARYPRASANRLLAYQAAVIGISMLLGALLDGVTGIQDAMLGGLVCLVPNAYFIWRLSSPSRRGTGMGSLYKAEAGKFGLTVALFAMTFALVPPSNPTFFFLTYVATLAVHWLAPWLVCRQSSPRNRG